MELGSIAGFLATSVRFVPHRVITSAMALAALSGDEQCIIFVQLCNVLDPGVAVAFSSTNSELWALTPALRQQLQADCETATALCLKLGKRSCEEHHAESPRAERRITAKCRLRAGVPLSDL